MNTEMQIFQFESQSIRTVEIDGVVWFVARDVSDVLGYSATSAMNKLIDEDDRKLITIQNGTNYQNQSLINESGLYQAIFGSTLVNAKKFKKWVTSEVLPAIRKTGQYQVMPAKVPVTPGQMFVLVAEQFIQLEERLLGMEVKQAALEHKMEESFPIDNYITILGFCTKYKLKLTTEERRLLGVDAAKVCHARKLMVDQVPDKRYGKVNAYPEEVLVDLVESPPC